MLNDFNDLIYSIQMIKSVSVLLMVLGACFTLLMGPDLSALTGLVG